MTATSNIGGVDFLSSPDATRKACLIGGPKESCTARKAVGEVTCGRRISWQESIFGSRVNIIRSANSEHDYSCWEYSYVIDFNSGLIGRARLNARVLSVNTAPSVPFDQELESPFQTFDNCDCCFNFGEQR